MPSLFGRDGALAACGSDVQQEVAVLGDGVVDVREQLPLERRVVQVRLFTVRVSAAGWAAWDALRLEDLGQFVKGLGASSPRYPNCSC